MANAKKKPVQVLGKTAHESASPITPANSGKGLTKVQMLAGNIAGHIAGSDKSLLPEVVAEAAIEIAKQIIEQTELLEIETAN